MKKIDEVLDEVDQATTEQATFVEELIAEIRAEKGTLTEAQEAKAAAIVGRLKSIGADHADPVPPVTE